MSAAIPLPVSSSWQVVFWSIAGRVVQVVVTLMVASFLTFSLLQLAPGDPVVMLLGERASDPDAVRAINARFHFDEPMLVQYWYWLRGVLTGDFGISLLFGEQVSVLVGERLPTTLLLVVYGGVLVIVGGFVLGLAAARSPKWADGTISALLAVGLATPSYVVAIVLITIFSLYLNWFPVFGSGDGFTDRLYHLTLPAITLALGSSAAMARITRASILEESTKDHLDTATARGFSSPHILWRHVVRNALLPITTIGGIIIAGLVAGTVIVEHAFGLDGIGSLLVLAVTRKDYAVVQNVTFIIIAAFLVVNAVVDLLYAAIDPRTRTAKLR